MAESIIIAVGIVIGLILAAAIFALGVYLGGANTLNTIRDLVDTGESYEKAYRYLKEDV